MTKKKLIKLSVFGVMLLLSGMAFVSVSADAKSYAVASNSPSTLYRQNCARCHGADGKAQTALGQKLEADDISGGQSTAKIIRAVTNGRGDMPSFRRKLTAAQIKAIAAYVHSL